MLGLDTLLMLATLSPRQREALVDLSFLGDPPNVVAARMGVHRNRVYQLRDQARKRLAVYRGQYLP